MIDKIVAKRLQFENEKTTKKKKNEDEIRKEVMAIRRIFVYVRTEIDTKFTESSRDTNHLYIDPKIDRKKAIPRTLGYNWDPTKPNEKKSADKIEPLEFYEMEIACPGSRIWNILSQGIKDVDNPVESTRWK